MFVIAGLDPRWPIDASGVAFSSDSTRIAVLFERNENLLVSSWLVANGRQQPDHVYGMGQLPVKPVGFTGRCLDWIADDTAWLLYGNAVVDVVTGKLIGELGGDDVLSQRVVDEDTVHIVYKSPASAAEKHLAIVDLDIKKLDELRDQIRKQ